MPSARQKISSMRRGPQRPDLCRGLESLFVRAGDRHPLHLRVEGAGTDSQKPCRGLLLTTRLRQSPEDERALVGEESMRKVERSSRTAMPAGSHGEAREQVASRCLEGSLVAVHPLAEVEDPHEGILPSTVVGAGYDSAAAGPIQRPHRATTRDVISAPLGGFSRSPSEWSIS